MIQLQTRTPAETQRLAAALEAHLKAGDLLLLSGDLGAGKTTFVQGLAAAMGVNERVSSPTFVLAATYEGQRRLHHLDVYRLEDANEARDLDLPGLLSDDAITAVEWGERVEDELGGTFLRVRIALVDDDSADTRTFEFTPQGATWQAREAAIERALKEALTTVTPETP